MDAPRVRGQEESLDNLWLNLLFCSFACRTQSDEESP